MVLLTQAPGRDGERTIAPPPPSPSIPPIADRGWADWGLALGVAAWAGGKVWGLFSRQQSTDSHIQQKLIQSLLDERKMLLEAVLKR
ncbi:MAG: hypothetical protein RLZZ511_1918 [Cyanobacteriota bacterium]|jgi:hypothetical protein